jgi:hypothetical protein
MHFDLKLRFTQHSVDGETAEKEGKEIERTVVRDTEYSNCWSLQILNGGDGLELTLGCRVNIGSDTLSVSGSAVVKFVSVDVEAKCREAIDVDPLANFRLTGHVHCCNNNLRVFLLELSRKGLVLRSQFYTVAAGRGVILNKHELVVLEGLVVSLIVQFYHIHVFYLTFLL